jgi:2-polyprenyl-3-methyl-5-hydroxy-6-metoxy-1,4-benzoquinol methylase
MSTQVKNQKKHNYEYDVDTMSASAPANVVRLVGTGKRVLEIGCGPGSITKVLATDGKCIVTGMELDPSAIEKVAPFCESIIQVDLNAKDWPTQLKGKQFDVVVAADVLEHLYNPWRTLEQMATLVNEGGYIVISLPHIGHAAILACLMNGNFDYRDWGLLDRTHIRFFGLKNIENLFVNAGLKIIDVKYVTKPPEETEFAQQWSALSTSTRAALRASPYANLYQVVVKAIPAERPGTGISLVPEEITPPMSNGFSNFKSRVGARLSPESKATIRKVLGKFGIKL